MKFRIVFPFARNGLDWKGGAWATMPDSRPLTPNNCHAHSSANSPLGSCEGFATDRICRLEAFGSHWSTDVSGDNLPGGGGGGGGLALSVFRAQCTHKVKIPCSPLSFPWVFLRRPNVRIYLPTLFQFAAKMLPAARNPSQFCGASREKGRKTPGESCTY